MRGKQEPLAVRFERYTIPEPNSGCLLWTASVDRKGYGRIALDGGKPVRAHRAAFFLAHGRWPRPMALHRCDTPACVNPAHIYEGTAKENALDRSARGRDWQSRTTCCPQGHPYSGDNLIMRGRGRWCRICTRDRRRANKQRERILRSAA